MYLKHVLSLARCSFLVAREMSAVHELVLCFWEWQKKHSFFRSLRSVTCNADAMNGQLRCFSGRLPATCRWGNSLHFSRLSSSILTKVSRYFNSSSASAVAANERDGSASSVGEGFSSPDELAGGGPSSGEEVSSRCRFFLLKFSTISCGSACCNISTSMAEKPQVDTFIVLKQRLCSCTASYSCLSPCMSADDFTGGRFLSAERCCC